MIQITFFTECMSLKDSKSITIMALKNVSRFVNNVEIKSNEVYDKFQSWYRTTYNLMTSKPIDLETAKQILSEISDKWEWNDDNTMPDSSAEKMGAKFVHPSIKFVTCYIEDLEPSRNKQNNREVSQL